MQSAPADKMAFSGPTSVAYAAKLWRAMKAANLVGPGAVHGTPYTGQPPHGKILDTLDTSLAVGTHRGALIVKRNYVGAGVSKGSVAAHPDRNLGSITVMFRREKGYDPADQDWFWAKYKPDGSLHTNPKGMRLAGRVAKGAPKGCIACHRAAPGGDFVFNHDRYARR